MAIPTVTREYNPGAWGNWIKLMSLTPRRKMRPDSPALHAEEFWFPNQTPKETRFPWWNCRESPRTLSEDEKKTDVTTGMQNRLVYPKSTEAEAHFPCIGSIAITLLHHIQLVASHTLGESRNSLRHPSQVWRNISFSKQLEESSMHHISSGDERWFPIFDWRGKPTFQKHLKRSFPSRICMLEGPCVFSFKWNGSQDSLTRKKAGFPCRGLNAGSSFISQDERMSECL